MKKTHKSLFLMIMVISLVFSMGGLAFAQSSESDASKTAIVKAVSRLSITANRTTATSAKITATGPVTSSAEYITTTATLYEYNSATGALVSTNQDSVKKTIKNCTTYSFKTTFSIDPGKNYKVKFDIKDSTNGKTNTIIAYSSPF